jgi:hypothetical protein
MRRTPLGLLVVLVTLLVVVARPFSAFADIAVGNVTLVSVDANGSPADREASALAMTGDGRYVVSWSFASNLTPGYVLPAGMAQAVLFDRQTNTTDLISRSSTNHVGDRGSDASAAISDDGRFVAFASDSTNLTNDYEPTAQTSIYLRDRQAGTTARISLNGLASSYTTRQGFSADGALLAYQGVVDNTGTSNGYLFNRTTGMTAEFAANVYASVISSNGQYVAYSSSSNLGNVYRYNIATGQSSQILGAQNYAAFMLNADGSKMLYVTPNDVNTDYNVYMEDIASEQTTLLATGTQSASFDGLSMSADSRFASYYASTAIDNHYAGEVFVVDTVTGQALLVDTGAAHRPSFQLADDGRQIMFSSYTRFPSAIDETFVAQLTSSDAMPPVVGTPLWSLNPKAVNQATSLTVAVSDDSSGVATGEYFVGDTDPGHGLGTPMNLSGTNLTTVLGTTFQPGVYRINIRAKDQAGNWSQPTVDYLVVYDPNGLSVTGKKTVVPSLAAGDILPGLGDPTQADKADFGFSVKYDNQGVIGPKSDMMLDYNTGARCQNPARAVNCHQLSINANTISWLVIDGASQSEGIFQGTASMVVDGMSTTNPFRITAVDGTRLDASSPDHLTLRIYAPGANPDSATPLYQLSQPVVRGNIKIR